MKKIVKWFLSFFKKQKTLEEQILERAEQLLNSKASTIKTTTQIAVENAQSRIEAIRQQAMEARAKRGEPVKMDLPED